MDDGSAGLARRTDRPCRTRTHRCGTRCSACPLGRLCGTSRKGRHRRRPCKSRLHTHRGHHAPIRKRPFRRPCRRPVSRPSVSCVGLHQRHTRRTARDPAPLLRAVPRRHSAHARGKDTGAIGQHTLFTACAHAHGRCAVRFRFGRKRRHFPGCRRAERRLSKPRTAAFGRTRRGA